MSWRVLTIWQPVRGIVHPVPESGAGGFKHRGASGHGTPEGDRRGHRQEGLHDRRCRRRSNRKLLKRRILIEHGRIGNYRLSRISPYIAFHGPGIEQREAIMTCNPPDIPGFDNTVPSPWEVQ